MPLLRLIKTPGEEENQWKRKHVRPFPLDGFKSTLQPFGVQVLSSTTTTTTTLDKDRRRRVVACLLFLFFLREY